MTRVGWVFASLVVLALAALIATTRFGGPTFASEPGRPASPKVIDHVEEVVRSGYARLIGGNRVAPTLIVPVQGVLRAQLADTWGQARSEGRTHHGTDIPAAQGTPVLAAGDGTIEKLFASRLGGITLYERSPDRRWTYYYAHLAGYAPGVQEGQVVRAGQPIAFVGDTGDAGVGNFHLHFGLTRTTPDQHWYEGEDVNAYPLLAAGAPRR